MQKHRHAAARQPRCLFDAEELLDADREDGWTARLVGELVSLPGGQFELRGGEPVEFSEPFVADGGLELGEPIGGGDVIERPEAGADAWEQRRQIGVGEWWQAEVGGGRGEPADAGQKTAGSGVGSGEKATELRHGFGGQDSRGGSGVADGDRCLVDDEVVPVAPQAGLHLPPRRVVEQLLYGPQIRCRERFGLEPGRLDGRRLSHARLTTGVVDVDGEKEGLVANVGSAVEANAPSADHRAAILGPGPQPHESVGKRLQERLHDGRFGILRRPHGRHVDEALQLLRRPEHVVRAAGVQFQVGPAGRLAGVEGLQRGHAVDDIGPDPHGDSVARPLPTMAGDAKGIPIREHRGGDGCFAEHTPPAARQQQPGQPRMRGQRRQLLPERRHTVVIRSGAVLDRAELMKELPRIFEALRGWVIEPGEAAVFAHGEQMQEGCREIPAQHLRRVCSRTMVVRGLIPQTPAHARPGAARPPRSLLGGGLRDRNEFQSGQPRGRRDTQLTGKA